MEILKILKLVNAILILTLTFTSTIGNVMILAAIWKTPSLQTVTNVMVFSLALSDLGIGVLSQPQGFLLFSGLVHYEGAWMALLQVLSVSLTIISLLTITAISVEKYLALTLHLRYCELVTTKRVICILVVIWLSSIAAASTLRLHDILFYKMASPAVLVCLVSNIFIYQKLYRTCRLHHLRIRHQVVQLHDQHIHQTAIADARFRKSAKTIFFNLFFMIICYLPFCFYTVALRIIMNDDVENLPRYPMLLTVYPFTWTMVFLNSTINPALLYFQLSEFRIAVRTLLRKLCRCRKHRISSGSMRPPDVKHQISLRLTFRFTKT